MKIARTYVISGRVQGVGYRYFAERLAHEHGICGYVKNLPNGSVEVYAIGNENSLEKFKRQLEEGPHSARVTGIEESEGTVREKYSRFAIE
jgi:acylphosphatase